MTTEPPRGLKANLKRSYNNLIDEKYYNTVEPAPEFDNSSILWRLMFALCFFHSNV